MNRSFLKCVCLLGLTSLSVVLAGCGGGGGGSGSGSGETARATVLFSGSSDAGARAFSFSSGTRGDVNPSEVDPADIESLTLTLTEIVFLFEGPDDGIDDDDDFEVVDVLESSFDPSTVSIEEGESVVWEFEGNVFHTITSGSVGDPDAGSLFDENNDIDGNTVEIEFNEVGTFPYFSNTEADIANAMTGTVIVEADDDDGDDLDGDDVDIRGEDGDDDDDDTLSITVFTGAIDIDLLSLTLLDVSSLITEVTLPAGEYKGIRLSIENPRLVLKSDPNTVITDVHLTANGRLFVKHEFDLGIGEDVLVTVHFGGIHLVETGSGMYVLLPQLSISAGDESAEIEFDGVIASISEDKSSMVVDLDSGFTSLTVLLNDDTFIHLDESRTESLTVDDLEVGMEVEVEGTANDDGSITAKEVEIEVEDELVEED